MLYIIEQYDTDKKLTYDTLVEKHHLNQWLAFQISGQGPYFGQASWSDKPPGNPLLGPIANTTKGSASTTQKSSPRQ